MTTSCTNRKALNALDLFLPQMRAFDPIKFNDAKTGDASEHVVDLSRSIKAWTISNSSIDNTEPAIREMCPTGCKPHPLPSPSSPAIRPAFDVLDSDRDGRISRDDLRAFYSFFSPTVSDDDIASMFSAADADRSGFVDFDEFRRVLPGIGGYGGGLMEEAFRVIDRDGDGRVGFDDLKAYLGWAGIHADDEEVRDMIRAGGCDEGVGVGFDDLLRILSVDFGQKF